MSFAIICNNREGSNLAIQGICEIRLYITHLNKRA